MKTSKIKISLGMLSLAAILFSACSNSTKQNSDANATDTITAHHHDGEHIYACPMHPEVTGKQGDKCPKCGMKLVHNDNAGAENKKSFFMKYACSPEQIESGKAATLSFTPKEKGNEDKPVPLDVAHTKKIHLIIVSEDLSYFEHIHPDYKASGAYEIKVLAKNENYTNGKGHAETKFDLGGKYFLFADYIPAGGNHTVDKIEVNVKGKEQAEKKYAAAKTTSTVDGYSVTLTPENGKYITQVPTHINGVVMKNGKEVDVNTMQDYLGTKAHMVVISLNEKEYLHVHPNVEGGKFDLHTTFEKPGIYRGWLQFQTAGIVHTSDFVFNVKQATADELRNAKKESGEMSNMKMDEHNH